MVTTDLVTAKPRPTTLGGLKVKASDELGEWGVCIAIYGPPGVGKTTQCARLANSPFGSPAVILDAEGGTRSVTNIKNLDIIEIGSWLDLGKASQAIWSSGKNCPWKTVIVDNMSEVQSQNMRNITSGIPEFQHWNRNTAEMLQFTRLWRDFARFNAVNVFLIAWSAPEKDAETQVTKQDVGFTPSLARQFPGIMDIVGYMTVEGSKGIRKLTFAASNRTAAKFRRADNEVASNIPLELRFDENLSPLVDIINTLRGNMPWPTEKYRVKETPKE